MIAESNGDAQRPNIVVILADDLGDFTEWPEYHPFNHGFDEFVGFNGSNDDFPVSSWRGDEEIVADIGADQAKYTGLFIDAAVEFIEPQKETPFFLDLSHKDPHLPLKLPIPTLGTYPNLYNLERDSGEAYNLAKKHPTQTVERKAALVHWRDAFYANPRGWRVTDDRSSTTEGD